MIKTIWCLFSIQNEYDQPQNNLEAWWSKYPTLNQVSDVIGKGFSVADLWAGKTVRYGNTDYRIEEVKEGVVK